MTRYILTLGFCVFYAALASAQESASRTKSEGYQDGFHLCSAAMTRDQGQWIRTGSFKEKDIFIYAHFINSYQKERPTILYFTGGPGGHSHNLERQEQIATGLGYNLLAFDHRGVGCSRPKTQAIYLDPDFYSSAHVAQDAKAIIDHLQLNKVSVWGVSYGTVPATIFASYYPQSVQALLLEGVFYQFISSAQMKKIVDRFWSLLSVETQKKIEAFHALPGNERRPNPVFQVLRDISSNHGWEAQKSFAQYLNSEGSDLVVGHTALSLWVLQNHPNRQTMGSALPSFTPVDENVYGTILMKELGRCTRDFNVVHYKVLSGIVIELKEVEDEDTEMACNELAARNYISTMGLQELDKEYIDTENFLIHYENNISLLYMDNKYYSIGDVPPLYQPERFYFKTPTFYFNGTYDLATPIDLAKQHYHEVTSISGQHHFLSFADLGHHPILEAYQLGTEADINCMNSLLTGALRGQDVKSLTCTAHIQSGFEIRMESK